MLGVTGGSGSSNFSRALNSCAASLPLRRSATTFTVNYRQVPHTAGSTVLLSGFLPPNGTDAVVAFLVLSAFFLRVRSTVHRRDTSETSLGGFRELTEQRSKEAGGTIQRRAAMVVLTGNDDRLVSTKDGSSKSC
jgi:hypothetical protein